MEASGAKSVIRFKVPREGRTEVKDMLRGELVFENSTIDDLVLLKSDGFPTYHLANVLDDHFMKISHVLRGDEWLVSTPRHVLLYQAFGWEPPQFAHLPIFLAPGGGKLSKRHGATSVREYQAQGYLPEAVFNFLLLLGWNPGTEQELFSLQEAAEAFTMERVNVSPVAFSTDKLDWFNGMYIRSLSTEELAKRSLPYLQAAGLIDDPCPAERMDYLVRLMPLLRERLKALPEIADLASYFLQEDIPAPARELLIPKKMDAESTLKVLEGSLEVLQEVTEEFKENEVEAALRGMAERLGVQDGQVFMPLRVAVSGRTATPGIFETMNLLGKERVLRRIEVAVGSFEGVGRGNSLPDWLMRREKWQIAALLGRCGPRHTASIVCGPRLVAPCTLPLLTTRLLFKVAQPIRQGFTTAHLGFAPKLGYQATSKYVISSTNRFNLSRLLP